MSSRAGVAQQAEQVICNHPVGGSTPFAGSISCVSVASGARGEPRAGLPSPVRFLFSFSFSFSDGFPRAVECELYLL